MKKYEVCLEAAEEICNMATAEIHSEIYVWPDGVQALGWLIPLSTTLLLPVVAIYEVWRRYSKGKPLGLAMFRPTALWKPIQDVSVSAKNLSDVEIRSTVIQRAGSKRGSRKSFRKHLPPNAETLE